MEIELSGDCTVGHAADIAAILRQAVAAGETVRLHLGDVRLVDASFFQLLHALQASCRQRGIGLEIAGPLSAGLAGKAAWAGFMACTHADVGGSCR